jgi:hypothetical protein
MSENGLHAVQGCIHRSNIITKSEHGNFYTAADWNDAYNILLKTMIGNALWKMCSAACKYCEQEARMAYKGPE